jgi:NAD(P)-dependent dehydrogenase (short-subunit alcohol dehydrogenase family)
MSQNLEDLDAEAIATQLRKDQQLCREKKVPTTLALQLSSASSSLLDEIAWHLTPEHEVSKALRSTRCNSIIKGIQTYLRNFGPYEQTITAIHIPTKGDLQTTLKVLDYLQKRQEVSHTSTDSLEDVIHTVRVQLSMDSSYRAARHNLFQKDQDRNTETKKRCYICRYLFHRSDANELYPSLCRQCGMFNTSCSQLSLPEKLNLAGKTALVTGGRINLGYAAALRLLRCGAKVIVSSRYPADAAARYAAQDDFLQWSARLKVVGADFRTANDAFRLVHIVRTLLSNWDGETVPDTRQYLDILINNAAQTLTDPIKAEMKAISREGDLKEKPETKLLLAGLDNGYEPRVRGGLPASWIPSIEGQNQNQIEDGNTKDLCKDHVQKGLRTEADPSKSSWVQTLNEIPYEDLISAHSVNAFVPLILCRELLPHMGTSEPSSKPAGYIVNVSSREGILEDVSGSRSKAGHHVHTNMSKAAINMITETEAQSAWKRRVAMNSVDPGYMSAAPECQRGEGCPIGFEDGAARVLWPIAVGEIEGRVISGRFLKHFQEGIAVTQRG